MSNVHNKNKQQNQSQNQPAKTEGTRQNLSFASMVVNSIRDAIIGRQNKGKDQITTLYETFGYKLDLTYDDYFKAYKRQGIAKRIINANVDFTWKNMPTFVDVDEDANKVIKTDNKQKFVAKPTINRSHRRVRTTENDDEQIQASGDDYTLFEESVYDLDKRFPLLTLFKKADKLACIGRFSIIVIGTKVAVTDDPSINHTDKELPKGTSLDDIAFFKAYSDGQVQIASWESDKSNPRYGLPKLYSVQAIEENGQSTSYKVHYTRVIHIAEDLLESEVYGTPKLEAVYNDLQDLLKVVGGGAEMFWLGAYQGLVFNVKDGYQLDEKSAQDITEQIENYVNKVQRFMKTKGMEVSTLGSSVSDPTSTVNVLIDLISGASNVPKRILLGAENGVYAGNTDQDTFFSYITSRRNGFIEESIIRPFLDRLIQYGYMKPAANNEYTVNWPPLFEQTQTEKLTNAGLMITAAKNATPFGNTMDIITLEEVREAIGLSPEKPESKYEEFAEEGDALMGDEMEDLPAEDDTTGNLGDVLANYRKNKRR